MADIVAAIFDQERDAERAVDWLRDEGVDDSAISVVRRRDAEYGNKGGAATLYRPADAAAERKEDAADAGKGALAGLGVGAGVGALFGLAAAMIPGVGPFITAGALASTLGSIGGGVVAGAVVGGTSGALAGALTHYGLNEAESKYYAGEIERGGTFVTVDLAQCNLDRPTVEDAFRLFNGRFTDASGREVHTERRIEG